MTDGIAFARLLPCFAVFFCLVSGGPDTKEKLEKEATKLRAEIKQEEERLAKKKDALSAEYAALSNPETQAKLAARLALIGKDHHEGLRGEKRKEAEIAIKTDVSAVVREIVGVNLAPAYETELAAALASMAEESAEVDGTRVLTLTIEELFEKAPFDLAFDRVIKHDLSRDLQKATARLAQVEEALREIAKAEENAKAGVPGGMISVPRASYRVGVDEAEIKVIGEKHGYRSQMEALLNAWLSTSSRAADVESFYLDSNEVTTAWYRVYLETHPKAEIPKFWKEGKPVDLWNDRPITGISYNQAVSFCRWMGRRLPTEFEWEAAARAGSLSNKEIRYWWPWGDEFESKPLRCNHDGASSFIGRQNTPEGYPPLTPVGSFPEGRSVLGFNDLSGNAAEFTTSPFSPYNDFKRIEIKRRTIGIGDFNSEHVTIRGGDAMKKDTIVSTFNRLGISTERRSELVGFRTAASKNRAKDLIDYLVADRDVETWAIDYPPLPSDDLKGRKNAVMEFEAADQYTALLAGGYDAETKMPTPAKWLAIANRKTEDFRDYNTLKALAKASKTSAVVLGYMYLDIPSLEPALEPGHYFVHFSAAHEVPPEAAVPEAPAGTDPAGKKPEKKPAGKKSMKTLPEALIFERRGVKDRFETRLEKIAPPVVVSKMPTTIAANGDTVEFIYSFPVKLQSTRCLTIGFTLKMKPEDVASFAR